MRNQLNGPGAPISAYSSARHWQGQCDRRDWRGEARGHVEEDGMPGSNGRSAGEDGEEGSLLGGRPVLKFTWKFSSWDPCIS